MSYKVQNTRLSTLLHGIYSNKNELFCCLSCSDSFGREGVRDSNQKL